MTRENSYHRRELLQLIIVITALLTAAVGGVTADATTTTQSHGHDDDSHHGETETTTDHHSSEGDDHYGETETTSDHHSGEDDGHHAETETTSGHHSEESSDDHHADDGGGDHHDQSSLAWLTSIAGLVAVAALPVGSAYWFGKRRNQFSDVDASHAAAIGLILVSAAVHLYLFLQHDELVMLLAGLGFVGAVVLFFLGVSRRLLYAVGILYVAAQLVLWWMSGMAHLQSYGLLDKVAQILLIGVLGYLLWTEEGFVN